ncbi:DUF2314 domain-containing protein [Salmonella enterica]|nr:DUF2314 domain-containing protein [Salmonella enterica]HCM1892189.1 DUF2314 domain-containing protein [Salmonella enterica subsp. diarizonae serovar 57:c:e,n,x,z15]EGQ5168448.1 DUF2314 domain-containing protein [Salmonella enterica]EKA4656785.1 DUF2314 domain-containing protein [Salmonella enterica]EKF8526225.1 DUF2314 domain-containing protein [Salmonella enterica]
MYTLDDGVELSKQFPDTFYVPSHDKIMSLTNGDLVKLIFREESGDVERMWVIISDKSIGEDNELTFIGKLDNNPFGLKTIKYGDLITFSQKNIIQIYE